MDDARITVEDARVAMLETDKLYEELRQRFKTPGDMMTVLCCLTAGIFKATAREQPPALETYLEWHRMAWDSTDIELIKKN